MVRTRYWLGFVWAAAMVGPACAQLSLPTATKPNGETLFRNQCATCHSLNTSDAPRQGPSLAGIIGRKAGTYPGFKYSPGFAKADFSWDDAKLDAYLANPQAVVPGAVMPYRQANPETRKAIIGYLDSQPRQAAQ